MSRSIPRTETIASHVRIPVTNLPCNSSRKFGGEVEGFDLGNENEKKKVDEV